VLACGRDIFELSGYKEQDLMGRDVVEALGITGFEGDSPAKVAIEWGVRRLGQQLELPVAKSDQQLRLWCLVAKGYTDLDLNPVSARRAWTEAKTIAHQLGEVQWEARAKGELGIIGFLEGDSRGAAMMVGDSLLSAMASGDEAGQVRMKAKPVIKFQS
jgi:hypothetical protein